VQLVGVGKVFGPAFAASVADAEDPDDLVDEDDDFGDDDEQPATGGATALDDVTLTIARGTFLGLAGADAAGKTTLIRLIAGTLVPTTGEIRVRGRLTPPPETLARLLPPQAAGAATLSLLARFLGLEDRIAAIDAGEVYAVAGLPGLEGLPFAEVPRRQVPALLVSAVLHLRPDVYLFDPFPKIADAAVRDVVETLLAERVRDGAVVVVTAEDADALPPATDLVARLELGRLASLEPRRARAQPEDAVPVLPTPLLPRPRRPAQGEDPAAVFVRVEIAPGGPPSIRMVVDVGAADVELVFGIIVRSVRGRAAKLRSPRFLLDAGTHEVVAELGAVTAPGRCTIEVAAVVGRPREPISWPSLLDVELPAEGAVRTAWSVGELRGSEVVEPAAVAAHEPAQAHHEQDPRENA
jgi:ABC-type polysaccharide/polyol phosphate transport system ATPase subunit